jgi:hypothetical protein
VAHLFAHHDVGGYFVDDPKRTLRTGEAIKNQSSI